jgi:O-antigen/teichoic acid export membrane protein
VTLLKRNLIANFAGSGWGALLSLAVLPACLRLMGVEAYGLVGIFTTLLSLLLPFEAGLGTALSRDLAGGVVRPEGETNAQVVRTLEIVHWTIAALSGALVAILAPLIAHHWVKPAVLTAETVQTAVLIMGLVIAVQWPQSLYSGGLVGLQHQVALNAINAVMGTIRSVGSVLVLMFVSRTVVAYFVWQIVASALQTGTLAVVLWHYVGERPRRPWFRRDVLVRLRPFLMGMTGTTIMVLLTTQLDKALLSRILPLAIFGYYMLANSAASNLLRFVVPVQQAFFPQFADLSARGEEARLAVLYHRMAQLLAVLTVPLALLVVLFAREALYVWTGDPTTAARTAPIVALLMFGTMVNALLYAPYTLQIASGWTSLVFSYTVVSAIVLVPALIALSYLRGAVGAAAVWPALNLGVVVFVVPLMHRRLIPREMSRWYVEDLLVPLATALAVVGAARLLLPAGLDRVSLFAYLAVSGFIAFGATVMVTETSRSMLFTTIAALSRRTTG